MLPFSWDQFYELTRSAPHWPLLQRAVSHLDHKKDALDLGAGAGRDTIYLLEQGFNVTAMDRETSAMAILTELNNPKLKVVQSAYDDFPFAQYDLINAQYALPFNPPATFNVVFDRIKQALRPGGVFTGQFFGVHDQWNQPDSDMTFVSREQAQELLSDLEVIEFQEVELDGTTADQTPKHWHLFHIIARKG